MDSVDKGYPVGIFLFWRQPAQEESVQIGPLVVPASSRSDADWVVDGQQRLVAITGALFSETRENDFSICFDLSLEKVVRHPFSWSLPDCYLPLFVAFDNELLSDWLLERRVKRTQPAWYQAALSFHRRLQEYAVSIHVVEGKEEAALQEIFKRLNSKGKRLRQSEVFTALRTGLAMSEPTGLRWLSQHIPALGFGSISEETTLRLLVAMAGGDISGRDLEPQLPSGEALTRLLQEALHVLRKVVSFLQKDANIPLASLLPYELPLPVLAALWSRFPEPAPRSRILLRRWLWRGASTRQHSGDSVSGRINVAAVREAKHEDDAIQRLLALLQRDERPVRLSESYSTRFAHTRLELLFLLSLRPRDLRSAAPLLPEDFYREGKLPVLGLSLPRGAPDAALASRFVHLTRDERGPLDVKDLLLQDGISDEVLTSHGVDSSDLQALREGNLRDFVEKRSRRLAPLFAAFLAAKTEWSQSDRPPLRSLDLDE